MDVLIKDSSLRIHQHLDDVARQTGKLAVICGVCPRSLSEHSTSTSLERLLTHNTETQHSDLLSLQASHSALEILLQN